MEETIIISNGRGLIDIRQGNIETVVYLNGEAISIGWNGCGGSVAQYLAASHLDKNEIELQLEQLRSVVNTGISRNENLKNAFMPILKLLTNGEYDLILYDLPHETFDELNLVQVEPEDKNGRAHFYPYDTLTRLQSKESLNPEKIKEFEYEISKGKRPVIICLTTQQSYQFFILDGHHKAEAYFNQKVTPAILVIEKNGPGDLSENETRSVIRKLAPLREVELIRLKSSRSN